jgi:hypothetical protein
MAREEYDPFGHLGQGFEWQDELDRHAADEAVYARLNELGALDVIRRFYAKNPPSSVSEKFKALLEKLIEGIRANLGWLPSFVHLPSRFELEALQELRSFAGESAASPESVRRLEPTAPAAPKDATPLHREAERRDDDALVDTEVKVGRPGKVGGAKDALLRLFPNGRPSLNYDELLRKLTPAELVKALGDDAPDLGVISSATLKRAIAEAWPAPRRRGRRPA